MQGFFSFTVCMIFSAARHKIRGKKLISLPKEEENEEEENEQEESEEEENEQEESEEEDEKVTGTFESNKFNRSLHSEA